MWKAVVVDDEPKIRRGFGRWIQEYGYPFKFVGSAANSQETLELTDNKDPHFFFLDIRIAESNGLELAKLIKSKNPKAILVMVTGYDYFEYAHEAIKLQVFDYLLKPVPKTDFFKTLENIDKALRIQYPDLEINKNYYENKNYSLLVQKVMEHIHDNYYKSDLSLEKIAKNFNINKSYLSTLMKEELGYSFKEYLTRVRIKKAKELLKEDLPGIKMYEIVLKIGYQSQHYFSRIFKKYEGVSPLDYRNKYIK
ncbi:response regulator transcription factor [Natranaerobius thermophilus]|uniref:Stage 0 sporulation protein A homolog n=1 Tax=Natranaerobius thermophilus (strain ATCC BAA-1301 / DSM 18059 / JW/NM-WN-LF) TaxID=457570 RepID=B2A194_NATTJ|nr:response regulator [Natranaerobius thermophilus]ACB86032.1 two component transcriptional regulator, AraC family [Natranaerobius thermophilus JW/NM-WN-LF]